MEWIKVSKGWWEASLGDGRKAVMRSDGTHRIGLRWALVIWSADHTALYQQGLTKRRRYVGPPPFKAADAAIQAWIEGSNDGEE